MLRIKRSVAAAFSQQHFNTTVIDAAVVSAGAAAPVADAGKRKREGEDSMAALEAAVAGGAPAAEPLQPGTRVKGFVSAGVIQQNTDGAAGGDGGAAAAVANPDEIALDEDDGEPAAEEGGEEGLELQQKAVPDAVFGSLAKKPRTDGS